MMARRAQLLLPEDLIREIDSLVGTRGRRAFPVETARREARRHWLLEFLESQASAWQDENHPNWRVGLAPGCAICASKTRL
jgi:hypothetical protein